MDRFKGFLSRRNKSRNDRGGQSSPSTPTLLIPGQLSQLDERPKSAGGLTTRLSRLTQRPGDGVATPRSRSAQPRRPIAQSQNLTAAPPAASPTVPSAPSTLPPPTPALHTLPVPDPYPVPSASGRVVAGATAGLCAIKVVTTDPSPPVQVHVPAANPTLWEQAYKKLTIDEQAELPTPQGQREEYMTDIMNLMKQSREHYQNTSTKFTFRGSDIILRDVANKVITWVEKFKAVGDTVIQFDPVHSASPSAGVRLLLQVALNHKETIDSVNVGIERVTRMTVRCAIFEKLYLEADRLSIHPDLEQSLVEPYYSILIFLIFANRYFRKSGGGRFVAGMLDNEGVSLLQDMEAKESYPLKDIILAGDEMQEVQFVTLKGILNDLEAAIRRTEMMAKVTYERLLDDIQQRTLKWLSQDRYEQHHETTKGNLLEETGQWLFRKQEYRAWRSSSSSGILWLRGIPGAGKTKLTCQVISTLQHELATVEPVVFFYFNRNDPERSNSTILLRSIIKQLCLVPCQGGFPQTVTELYEQRKGRGATNEKLTFKECSMLLVPLLNLYPQSTIRVDGLDECESDHTDLLDKIGAIMRASASLVKIFISSREGIDITAILENVPNLYLNAQDNKYDLSRFVYREIWESKNLLRGNASDELRRLITTVILAKANGMFQWADLQIKTLCKMRHENDIRANLGKLPATLEKIYALIWSKIQECKPYEKLLAERAFAWVLCSREPLNRSQWTAACYSPYEPPRGGTETLFDICSNLVVWNKQLNRVVFAHLSIQEYIEKNVFDFIAANTVATLACLCLLTGCDQLSIDEYDIVPNEQQLLTQVWEEDTFTIHAGYQWPYHVENSFNPSIPIHGTIIKLLEVFLGEPTSPGMKYCKWLENAKNDFGNRRYDMHYNAWMLNQQEMLSRRIVQTLDSDPVDPLFALCQFKFGLEPRSLWQYDKFMNHKNKAGQTFLAVAIASGNQPVVLFLLEGGANTSIVEGGLLKELLLKVVKGWLLITFKASEYGKLLEISATLDEYCVRWVLQHYPEKQIGEGDTTMTTITRKREFLGLKSGRQHLVDVGTADSEGASFQMTEMRPTQLDNQGANILITGEFLVATVRNRSHGRHIIVQVLKYPNTTIEITGAVLLEVMRNYSHGSRIIDLALKHANTNIEITEDVLVAAITNRPPCHNLMATLLQHQNANINIRGKVFPAMVKDIDGRELMAILVSHPSAKTIITETFLVAVINGGYPVSKIIIQSLQSPSLQTHITAVVLIAAIRNGFQGSEIMTLLLGHPDVNIKITEDVLIAMVENPNDEEIMSLLLKQPTADSIITLAVLRAAIKNIPQGSKIMALLLEHPDANIKITKDVIIAMVEDFHNGENLKLFLQSRSTPAAITDTVLVATVESQYHVKKKTALSPCHPDRSITITEAIPLAAARREDDCESVVALLLPHLDGKMKITEAVLVSAVGNKLSGVGVLDQFIRHLHGNMDITEAILISAVENTHCGEMLTALILQRVHGKIEITEDVLLAATRNSERITALLLQRLRGNTEITEAALAAATKRRKRFSFTAVALIPTIITQDSTSTIIN